MPNGELTWIDFYMEFADKLRGYKHKRLELIERLKTVFSNLSMRFPKVEADDSVVDLDPFSVFAFFNKGITDTNRKRIISEIKREFGIKASVPEGFLGVPVVNNQSAAFFYFLRDGRGEQDIDNLWNVFEAALEYDKEPGAGNKERFATAFDIAEQQPGVKWNLTMGLYWCRPERYMNLDSRNRWFMEDAERFPKEILDEFQQLQNVPKGIEYLHLCKLAIEALANGDYQYKSIPEFSMEAWLVSEEVNKRNKKAAKAKALRKKQEEDAWWPSPDEYNPGITKNDWVGYLSADGLLSDNMLAMLKRMKDMGGAATCSQLSEKYGESFNFYLSNAPAAAERIAKVSGCPLMPGRNNDGSNRWWPVLFVGKNAPKDASGSYAWKLRTELSAALDEIDLSHIPLYAKQSADVPIAEDESTPELVGEGYDKDGVPKAALTGEMVLEVLASGDVLSNKEILCRIADGGRISGDALDVMDKRRPRYESRVRWAIEKLYKKDGFIDKVETGMYVINAHGIAKCRGIGLIKAVEEIAPYGKDDFLREVYMREVDMKALVSQLKRKMNIILQGAPGTGKTYAAKRLANLMMGKRDDSRVKIVQFHQSTAYDDFVCGYRPVEGGGYEPRAGVFVQFCRKATSDPDRDYFFIIDEINRANISKVFGELLMLIEKDHREDKITFALNNEQFSVPRNVYIIGMMNTADRGLALIDYALRRRFAFFEMNPALENPAFRASVEEAGGSKLIALVDAAANLNETIAADPALGRGFRIGHSYFCDDSSEDDVAQAIIRFEIAPLLEEYWFDDPDKAEAEIRRLEDAVRESDE